MSASHRSVVLIATGDLRTRELVAPLLHEHGVAIESAEDEQSAFLKAVGGCPAVVVADLGAPDVNAMRLRDRLKKDGRTRHIPILSVHGSPETWLRAASIVCLLVGNTDKVEMLGHIRRMLCAPQAGRPS